MTQSCGIESLAAVTVILEPGGGPGGQRGPSVAGAANSSVLFGVFEFDFLVGQRE